jgi:cell wall-associated NlpC family hydrolase
MQLTRQPHWPEGLAAVIAAAQEQPYQIGQHDCLRLSCAAIAAMCGVDLWPHFAGYTTRREAVAVLGQYGPTLAAAACKVVGVEPLPVLAARRGDLLTFADKYGEHLGICTGTHVAVLGHQGLIHLRLDHPGLQHTVKVG